MDSFKQLVACSFNLYLITTHMPSTVGGQVDREKGVGQFNKDLALMEPALEWDRQTNSKTNEYHNSQCWEGPGRKTLDDVMESDRWEREWEWGWWWRGILGQRPENTPCSLTEFKLISSIFIRQGVKDVEHQGSFLTMFLLFLARILKVNNLIIFTLIS